MLCNLLAHSFTIQNIRTVASVLCTIINIAVVDLASLRYIIAKGLAATDEFNSSLYGLQQFKNS